MRFALRLLAGFLRGILLTLGTLTLLVLVLGVAAGAWFGRHEWHRSLPDAILLTADLRGTLPETMAAPGLRHLGFGHDLTVSDAVRAIDAAAHDPRIKGMVARLDEGDHGLAVAQELRDAVRRFRAAGKPAIAHADSFGELGPGNEGYYLATAFDEIDLQPVGLVGLTGLAAQVPYVKDLLDRLGVQMEVAKRKEFKSAFESLTDSRMSAANREQLGALLDDFTAQLVDGIAQGRRLPRDEAARLLGGGPYTTREAIDRKLVDHVIGYDPALTDLRRRLGGGPKTVSLQRYAGAAAEPASPRAQIAFVRAEGTIQSGEGSLAKVIAADTFVAGLRDAVDDPAIAAILLRIDSPGGSAVASESIAALVRAAKAAHKPVVVSMGNTAASGGYWIAMAADRIVAEPGTITGSIGVIAGKPVVGDALARLGASVTELDRGQNAGFQSLTRPWSPTEQARIDTVLDDLYASFVDGAAQGRHLPRDEVEALARGRVWSGAAAKGHGLVDRLGGMDVAMGEIRARLGLPADAELALEDYPRPQSILSEVADLAGQGLPSLGSALHVLGFGLGTVEMPSLVIR